tara:strand:- start:1741 stop:2715 length:975 start_codon:yes stop_codon:yes gene_type:complete
MKILDLHFDEYIKKSENNSLHSKLVKLYDNLPKDIKLFKNMILYGSPGVGKYTQMLELVKRYSQSKLKYEKKMTLIYNKINYNFKMSDIHFEIDMALLGCNSKVLWHEIYNNILDIIITRPNKSGIIVCKNFHIIHSELHDIFYSYMQNLSIEYIKFKTINLKYILITDNIGFIEKNIINSSVIINIPRPSKIKYKNICKLSNERIKDIEINEINNIKNIQLNVKDIIPHKFICDNLINYLLDINNIKYINIREKIYDIFIYNLNIYDCIWYIITELVTKEYIKNIHETLLTTYKFLQLYNNNYRPIYHLENYIFYLLKEIHEF